MESLSQNKIINSGEKYKPSNYVYYYDISLNIILAYYKSIRM
jgi:hypothetical protein